jgi:RNA polymerase sigma-70 factor (ECF subfamily)
MHDPSPSSQDEPPLAALLHAAARGDARAFEQFYGATCRQALAVVRRITGTALAEDVLSDCYFQAWRDAARFDAARGDAIAWLLTIARSRALDRMRKETLRHGGLSGAPEFDPATCEDVQVPGPEALLQGLQERSHLHAALAALSANERWVLGLAYYRDFTQAEIAGITQLPLGTVKSLMTRAQHKLREALQNRAH